MTNRKNTLALWLMILMVFATPLAATAARAGDDNQKTFYGKPHIFGDGVAETYVTVDKNGIPIALGIEVPAKSFASLPSKEQELIFEFPKEARNTPFRFMDMSWNPQGHEPDKIYTMPHFDFHFYLQSKEEKDSIDAGPCKGLDCADYARAMRAVPAHHLPRDYRNVGAVVPKMGNHLIDPASGEFNHQPFTRTFLYGSYDGKITFYEPMLSLAYLQSQPDEYPDLKLPAAYAETGYYPTRYSVRYDTGRNVYRISLERFIYHVAR